MLIAILKYFFFFIPEDWYEEGPKETKEKQSKAMKLANQEIMASTINYKQLQQREEEKRNKKNCCSKCRKSCKGCCKKKTNN